MRFPLYLLMVLLLLPLAAEAAILRVDDSVTISDERINENLYVISSEFLLDSIVQGDVTTFSRASNFMRPIHGDLMFASGESTINADVDGDVRAVVADLIVSADIDGDLVVAGGNVRIDSNAHVAGDILAYVSRIELVNLHRGSLNIAANKIILNSAIEGDAELRSPDIEMRNGARIEGDLIYTAPRRNEELEERTHGEVTFNKDTKGRMAALLSAFGIGSGMALINFAWLLVLFALGLLILHVCPNFAALVASNMTKKRRPSIIYGLVFIFVVPLLSFLFLASVIGIPIAALLMISLGLGFVFGKIYTIFVVGGYLRAMVFKEPKKRGKKKGSPAQRRDVRYSLDYSFGLLIYALLSLIPFISVLVGAAAAVFGIGAMALAKMELFYFLKENKKL